MHPLDNSVSETSDVSSNVRKMPPNTYSNGPDFDAMNKFDFAIGQDRGLKSFQRQLCDYPQKHHADRSIGESREIQQMLRQKNSIRQKTNANHRS